MSATTQINIRVPGEVAEELDWLAKQQHLHRVDVARQILLEGISRQRRELALRLYRRGEVSKAKAAEMTGISLWEMMDLVEREQIPSGWTLQDATEEVERIVQRYLHSEGEAQHTSLST